jgi:formate hydrogenlyase subunit 3/multisubunit Na+/H+ antiporter MnhD subunit
LSEFSILKAGLTQKEYVATGLLAIFIVIAFFGIMLHINRMVFGAPDNKNNGSPEDQTIPSRNRLKNFICRSVAGWR